MGLHVVAVHILKEDCQVSCIHCYRISPPYSLSDKTRVQRPRSSLDNVILDMDGKLPALYIDFAEAKSLPVNG